MELKRVVVTGIGTINPLGKKVTEYFTNLEKGLSVAAPIQQFDAEKFKTRFACEVRDFDPCDYMDRKEARKFDRFTHFAAIASDEAIKDSGLDFDKENRDRIGVIYASGIGGLISLSAEIQDYEANGRNPRYSPFMIVRMISDTAAGYISIKYGLRGPNYCTVSACSSANHAMIDSAMWIRLGKADVIVTGGAEAPITHTGIGGFNSMQALSKRNDDPLTASRPFDADRDGFVMGEGAGTLVLEEYEHAVKRGARIYAELVGGGISADAYHISATHPDGLGAKIAMQSALDDAGIAAEAIDYVNLHGTSTPVGDIPELLAVQQVFGQHVYDMNLSSTKSMTGHLLGASAAIEAIACIMAIDKGVIPPTINNFVLDPKIDPKLNLTLNKAQYRSVNYAMSNTFGFGGHNSSVVLKKI